MPKTGYRPAKEMRKEIAAGVREGMKLVKKSAKNAEGSRLKLGRGSKTARTIKTRVRAATTEPGIRTKLEGSGWLNVWEKGRKPYTVTPRNRRALSTPRGLRPKAAHKLQAARPVLPIAMELHLGDIQKNIADKMANAAANGLSRTIKARKPRGK